MCPGFPAGEAKATEAMVIEANRDFYRCIARKYDKYESCTFDRGLQRGLEQDLDRIHALFYSLGRTPHCLDCGGGTGNLTLKMCSRGWSVTTVDISGEMLDLLKNKARSKGYSPVLVQSPIEDFLEKTHDDYDFVGFSSVLHHLHSYAKVIKQVIPRIRIGGFFYSNYDPVVPERPRLTGAFDSLDIAIAKIMLDSADVLPGIGRRIRRLFSPTNPLLGRAVLSLGDIAEYHVKAGVDDREIVRLLKDMGLTIVEHHRYATGRTKAVQFLDKRLRLLENFKIIAQRQ